MSNFFVIPAGDKRWHEYISACDSYDFYHTACYHALEAEGTPLLFVAEGSGEFIALPLLIREIGINGLKDITSSYGFSGPVSSTPFANVTEKLFYKMRKGVKDFFDSENVITAFSRLHPMICGDRLFDGFGDVKTVKQMVGISLRRPFEEQVSNYRKSTYKQIAELRQYLGYTVRQASDDNDIDLFTAMYHENMRRVKAATQYFFDAAYFKTFLNNECFDARLMFALKNGAPAAGAIFTITSRYMQYHLAATKSEYIQESPMKVLVDEARTVANQLGLEYFHLGGSVGDSNEDPLFRFKAGFSKERFNFRVWQYIHNKDAYEELNAMRPTVAVNSNYFPRYRS